MAEVIRRVCTRIQYPRVYIMYYVYTYYIPTRFFPPDISFGKFVDGRRRHTTLARILYIVPACSVIGIYYYFVHNNMYLHLPCVICARYNMRIKVPPLYVSDKTQFLRCYQKKNLQIRRTSAS